MLLAQHDAVVTALLDAWPTKIILRKDVIEEGETLQLHARKDVVDDVAIDGRGNEPIEGQLSVDRHEEAEVDDTDDVFFLGGRVVILLLPKLKRPGRIARCFEKCVESGDIVHDRRVE
jgi:hypothetical protein